MRSALFLVLWLALGSAQAAVRAWVDSDRIAADGTLQLTLEHDGQTNDDPNLEPLKQDFDILTTSRGSSIQIVNGSVSARVRVQIALSPKHGGEIQIPAIDWGGEQSAPLTVKFGAASNGPNGTHPGAAPASKNKVYLETTVDTKQPYVQAGVQMTVKIYAGVALFHASLDLPANSDVLVQQIGSDKNTVEIKDGQRYQVVERHYVIFPQHSGAITLPAPTLDGQIPVEEPTDPYSDRARGFFSDSLLGNVMTSLKPIRIHGDAIALNVLARPDGAGDYWLPARDVTLQGDWQPSDSKGKVGDPITLSLHLKAQGLTAAQLPDFGTLLDLPAGIKAYPDQPKLNNETHGDALVGSRDQSIALIADQPGQFVIPPLTIHWWDTDSRQEREVSLPGKTLVVAPSGARSSAQGAAAGTGAGNATSSDVAGNPAATSAGAAAPAQAGKDRRWLWVSIALGVLWIATLLAWYRTSRRLPKARQSGTSGAPDEAGTSVSLARTSFQQACRRNDARAARTNLIRWLNAARPGTPSTGLRALFVKGSDRGLTQLLVDLDRACFAGGAWDGAALLAALDELPKPAPRSRERSATLASLYP
jgi:BatD DUF11 like domain